MTADHRVVAVQRSTAAELYDERLERIESLAAAIVAKLKERRDLSPSLNWADVGDASHILEDLANLADGLGIEL